MPVLRVSPSLFARLRAAVQAAIGDAHPDAMMAPVRRDVVVRLWQEFQLAEQAHLPGLPVAMEMSTREVGALAMAFEVGSEGQDGVDDAARTRIRTLLGAALAEG